MKKINNKKSGFTLIELMVSVSIFVIIMVISMGSILTVFDANKKSQSLRAVMDNLNFSMEAMTRTIRFGTNYHCDVNVTSPAITLPRNCTDNTIGASSIVLIDSSNMQVIYMLENGQIKRSTNNGLSYISVTSSDVTITDLKFRVFGSAKYSTDADLYQPQVIITLRGYAGTKPTIKSSFSLETTVSQRMFDSQ